ncbi:hypothetical protein AC579_2108 [Pseudocercospora musae]|uniref:Uncharacterized protein n=1 Tax=Pseudocercospora musae TaxID=113226 RepID=A0A139GT19_9PEZI|nr:hypothetical protein AC579_2108 [Pseudocercospora musae]
MPSEILSETVCLRMWLRARSKVVRSIRDVRYGGLRLARLNWIYQFTGRGVVCFTSHREYGMYFSDYIVSANEKHSEPNTICHHFAVGAFVLVTVCFGSVLFRFLALFMYNAIGAFLIHMVEKGLGKSSAGKIRNTFCAPTPNALSEFSNMRLAELYHGSVFVAKLWFYSVGENVGGIAVLDALDAESVEVEDVADEDEIADIKAIKFERDELQKQLDAEKGQYKIMQATAADLRSRLEDEGARVAQVRTKEGWNALEEKKTAIVALEAEKQAMLEKSSADEQERAKEHEQLTTQIWSLQERLFAMETKATKTHTDTMDLLKALDAEKSNSKQLASEVERLEKERDDMETTMSAVKAAADALSGKQTAASASREVRSPMSRAGSAVDDESSELHATNPQGDHPPSAATGLGGTSDVYEETMRTRPGSFPSGDHGLASPPLSQGKMSPGPEATSPGFRTIHGIHRPGGALGSYSHGGGTRKKGGDDSSSRNGGGSNSTSSEKDYAQGSRTTFEDCRNGNSNELGQMPTEIVQGTAVGGAWRGVPRWSRGVPHKFNGMIDGIGRSSEAKSPPLPERPNRPSESGAQLQRKI